MFEADNAKAVANLDKHGLPLDDGQLLFDGPFIEEEYRRSDYGETVLSPLDPLPNLAIASVLLYLRGEDLCVGS